jgi:hypothetical protein
MTFVTYNCLRTIAKHLAACAGTIIPALAIALGLAQAAPGQTIVSNYSTLLAAIPQGVVTNFSTNATITLATASETFNITNNVYIDGTTNQVVLDGNRLARLFKVATNATLTLANLQILGGISTMGGAIYNQGTLVLSNCFFYSNAATNANGVNGGDGATNGTANGTGATSGGSASGGAIYSQGPLLVSYTTFSNNVVTAGTGGTGGDGASSDFLFGGDGGDGGSGGSASGGAIFASGTNNMFYATQFIGNQCVAGSGGAGGAGGANRIAGDGGSGGAGGSATGGALLVSGPLYMTNCLFYTNSVAAGNSAAAKLFGDGTSNPGLSGGAAVGGGVDVLGGTPVAYIENAIFFNNFCQAGAGGDTMDNPPSAAAGNGGPATGGGLSSAAALMQLRCCTLATNVIVAGTNGVSTSGGPSGAVGTLSGFDIARTAGTLRVSGTIFSGGTNAAPNYAPNCGGVITDAGYNLSSDTSALFTSSTSRSNLDSELDSGLSSNNGGPNLGPASLTVPTLSLALLAANPPAVPTNSPAIGALLGIAGVTFPATDETLAARGNVADIGAFELTPPPTNFIAPTITSQPASQSANPGSNVVFTVLAQGDNLGYQWFKNATNLLVGANGNLLTLTKLSLTNAGSYSVLVGNSLGLVPSQVAVLTVMAPPVPPTVAIASPAANARTTNFVLSGTASGQLGIEAVNYWITNLNNGLINVSDGQETLTSRTASVSWTILTNLPPGTNVLAVQSVASGVNSAVVSRTFFYEVPAPFTLTINGDGNGTVTGAASVQGGPAPTNHARLYIGEGYSLTAAPNPANSLFAGWTVSTGLSISTSTNLALQFIMQSNLTLQATFISNFFLAFAGTYNGLFYDTNAVTEETAGMLSGLTLGKQGAYGGRVRLGGNTYPITGTFDVHGHANAIIPRSPQQGGPITLAMNLSASPPQILGEVSSDLGTASLIADLATRANGSAQYTMLLEPSAASTSNSPPGDGFALITDSAGTVTLSGALADGTSLSQTVPASETGEVPVYASLYTNTGLLLGWINLSNLNSGPLESMALGWIKKVSPWPGLYTNGFTNLLSTIGSRWVPRNPAITLNAGQLVVSNSSFSNAFNVEVTKNNGLETVPGAPANTLAGSINPKNGMLTLKFGIGSGPPTNAGVGAVLQNQAIGGGYFLTPTNAGKITLSPDAN